MRSFHLLATLIVALVVGASVAQAGNVVRYTDGSLGVVSSQKAIAERLDITVTPEALAYGDAWEKAVKIGKPVPVETHTERSAHHLTLTTTTVASKEVVLKQGAVIVESVSTTLRTEESFNPFFVLVGIAVVSMTLGLFFMRNLYAAFALSFVTAFFTIIATDPANSVATIFALFATLAAAMTAIVGKAEKCTLYIASAAFYGAITLAALTVYF